jgi:hypothetical protein
LYDGLTVRRRLCRPIAALLVCVAVSDPAAAVEVRLQLTLPSDTPPATVEVHWTQATAAAEDPSLEEGRAELEAPGSATLDLTGQRVWSLSVASESFWAAPELVSVGTEPAAVRLALWPTARLVGEIEVEPGENAPEKIGLRFESPPDAETRISRSTVSCPLEDRSYECRLPATRLDLRLRAKHFVSHYYWDVELRSDAENRLPKARLRRGASVVGWVEPADPRAAFDRAAVTLERELAAAGLDEASSARRRGLALSSKANERGFFEVTGVEEGLYGLTVTHPEFAPARHAPIRVYADAETELPLIALDKGVDLRLNVEPGRAPTGARWRVELLRRGEAPGHLEEAAEGTADADGRWKRAALPPATYVLRIHAGAGETWHSEELSLPAGAESWSRTIQLDADKLAGLVLLGSEPIAADLYFGGYHGALRIPASSDEEGLFEAVVPALESWTVDVYAKASGARQRFSGVVPEPAGEDGRRWLELVLPDTLVEGRVVDVEDEPVAGARVRASGSAGGMTLRSEEDGSFEMRGLRPGEYWLRAITDSPPRRSRIHRFELEDGVATQPFELVLTADRRIEGQVVGPGGRPVIGAKIVGRVEQTPEQPVAARVPEAETGLDGTFSMELAEAAGAVQLTVFPPGFAVRQVRIDSRSPHPVVIPVEPHGGTLRVEYDTATPLDRLQVFNTFLLPFYPYLVNWATLNGEANTVKGVLSLPMLEPGFYRACGDFDFDVEMTGLATPSQARCAGGQLSAYGELELSLSSE